MNTRGVDKTMMAAVAGMVRRDAYLIEYWKMVLSVFISFSGFSLEKAGKSTVAMGVVKKVISTTKFTAAL